MNKRPEPQNPSSDPTLSQLLSQLGDGGSLEDLDEDMLAELADRVKAARAARRAAGRATGPRLPQRALALDALEVLGVPATPRVIAAVVQARAGATLDPRALTTARRDDRRVYDRDLAHHRTPAPKLAPALHHELLDPVRALVTVSTWPMPLRTITPHSPRHDHPATVLALLTEADRLADVDVDAAERVVTLACRLSRGFPGVTGFDTSAARDLVQRAATEELARFRDLTLEEREVAANRAQMLDSYEQVWGRAQKPSVKAAGHTASETDQATGTRR